MRLFDRNVYIYVDHQAINLFGHKLSSLNHKSEKKSQTLQIYCQMIALLTQSRNGKSRKILNFAASNVVIVSIILMSIMSYWARCNCSFEIDMKALALGVWISNHCAMALGPRSFCSLSIFPFFLCHVLQIIKLFYRSRANDNDDK